MDINKGKHKLEIIKGLILIAKISLASGVSWELAKMLGSKHPYLAPLTVILFIELSALFLELLLRFLSLNI
jgi:hypothetical protein